MQQTLLAFLAMLILAVFALTQQRALFFTNEATYDSEFEMAATDLAMRRLALVGRRAYDAATTDREGAWRMTDPNAFSDPGGLGRQSAWDDNDLDDFNADSLALVTHTLNGERFAFRLGLRVRYVDPATLEAASDETMIKEIEVTVYKPTVNLAAPDTDPADRYVRLTRLFTHGGRLLREGA